MKYIKHPNRGNAYGHGQKNGLKDVAFYHQEALGSVVMTTGINGQVIERYAYEGKFSHDAHSMNPYGFTGKRYEVELGIYSFAYRHYNPQTMQWMTLDPIKDGNNWYQYVNGDPVNYVDPLGLNSMGFFDTDGSAGAGGLIVPITMGALMGISRQKQPHEKMNETLPRINPVTDLIENFGLKVRRYVKGSSNNNNPKKPKKDWAKVIKGTAVVTGIIAVVVAPYLKYLVDDEKVES